MNPLTARMFGKMDEAVGFGSNTKGHLALLWILARNSGGDAIEIGVNNGYTTLALLAGVTETGCRLVSVDKKDWCEAAARRTCGIAVDHWNWTYLREFSINACHQLKDGAFGLVFIDGDHSYPAMCLDLKMYERKLRPDGILAGHDYRHIPGVERAVREFMEDRPGKYRLQVFEHDCGLFVLWPRKTFESSE